MNKGKCVQSTVRASPSFPLKKTRKTLDMQKLLHELHVYQIELEMQNEQLRSANAEVEVERDRYVEFYNFSPVCFIALDREGKVCAVNRVGARLLGLERTLLLDRDFRNFVDIRTRHTWNDCLARVFSIGAKRSCEVILTGTGNLQRQVRIEAVLSRDRQECRAVIIDLTEHKKAQEVIVKKNNALEEIIAHIDAEKDRLKENILVNVKKLVLPIIKKLPMQEEYQSYKILLEDRLKNLTSSFVREISEKSATAKFVLTAKEIEICAMIEGGMKNKEIARSQGIAVSTVETERKTIRKKLHLTNTKANLSTTLQSFE